MSWTAPFPHPRRRYRWRSGSVGTVFHPPRPALRPLEPTLGLGRAVGAAIGVAVLVLLTVAVLLVVMLVSLQGATEQNIFDVADTVLTLASVMFFVGLAGYAAVVPAAALTIWWTYRVRRNLDALGARPRFAAGWAVAGWLIPVANLVLPYLVLREVLVLREGLVPGEVARDRTATRLLVGWWVSLLAAVTTAGLAALVGTGDPGAAAQRADLSIVDGILPGLSLAIAGLLLAALAGVLFILLVRRLSRIPSPPVLR